MVLLYAIASVLLASAASATNDIEHHLRSIPRLSPIQSSTKAFTDFGDSVYPRIAFSRSGEYICTPCHENSTCIWSGASGSLVTQLPSTDARVTACDWSNDEKLVAVGNVRGFATVYTAEGEQVQKYSPPRNVVGDRIVTDLRFVPDLPERELPKLPPLDPDDIPQYNREKKLGTGGIVLSSFGAGYTSAWEVMTGAERYSLRFKNGKPLCSVAASGGATVLLTSTRKPYVFKAAVSKAQKAGEQEKVEIEGIGKKFGISTASGGCAVAPDSSRVCTTHNNASVLVWDISGSEALVVARADGDYRDTVIHACAFTPDGSHLLAASSHGFLVWSDERLHAPKVAKPVEDTTKNMNQEDDDDIVQTNVSESKGASTDIGTAVGIHPRYSYTLGAVPALAVETSPDGRVAVLWKNGTLSLLHVNLFPMLPMIQGSRKIDLSSAPFALHSAVLEGNLPSVITVLENGANANAQVTDLHLSPMHIAALSGQKAIMLVLASRGTKLNLVDAQGRSALHIAAMYGRTDCVKALLQLKADPNAQDVNGHTALHLAAMNRHVSSVSALVDAGASTTIPDKLSRSSLSYSVSRELTRAFGFLA